MSLWSYLGFFGHVHHDTEVQFAFHIDKVGLTLNPLCIELYTHEWASFSTKEFAENRIVCTGDVVKCIMIDVEDRGPVDDIIWYDEDYRTVFKEACLEVEKVYHPLGREDEPFCWVNEAWIPPWTIYVLKKR
ncbi:MAG TPA: hypothetical protein VK436_08130 [Methanocella sp.]|nr:hypothetical protein [Methanocella sp.]